MSYWKSTRHPAPGLMFLAPLLLAYEIGVVSLGGAKALSLRNGADVWMREGLSAVGAQHPLLAPAVIVVILSIWLWRQRDATPEDLPGLCLGMAVESIGGALLLWSLSRGFAPMLETLGLPLSAPPATDPPTLSTVAFGQVVTYVGAGIYEEVLFRLVFFGGLCAVLLAAAMPKKLTIVLAALASAVLFAAAHHVGPHGEPVDGFNFIFRVLAGLYFTLLFQLRGCGIAVGAHACYDVLVGINM